MQQQTLHLAYMPATMSVVTTHTELAIEANGGAQNPMLCCTISQKPKP
jgi:hypothetical protein